MLDPGTFYPSLRALQDAHRTLLQRYRKAGKLTDELRPEIEGFLRTGSATGRILDALSDQSAAQGLLDYWATILYREGEEIPEPLLAAFDPSAVPQLGDVKCPYVGLRSFRKDEDSLFFGRENLTRDLLGRLQVGNFVAVIGPPSSGRTSLVQAGLLAALAHDQLPGCSSWPVHERCPPFKGQMALRADELTSVTIIDDCDDIFAPNSGTSPEDFAREVATFADAPGIRRIIILVLRSDYEDRFTRLSSLEERIKQAQVRVTEPTAKEIREAIERPAERVGLKFEDGVVEAIVHELVGEPAAFALLQFSMLRLWDKRSNNRITWTALQQAGIGRSALVTAAQDFYDRLSSEDRHVLRQVLVRLGASAQSTSVPWDVLAKASDSSHETDHVLVKLRAAPRSVAVPWDVLSETSDSPSEADRLLEAMEREGLVTVAERASDKKKTVKLAHDSLLEQWDVLAGWLKQESDQLDRRLQLEAKARAWETRSRPNDALLTEVETIQAKEWLNSSESLRVGASPNLRAFVDASGRWHERRIRRKMGVLALGIVFFAATTAFAGYNWIQADRERDRATQARAVADQARADEHLQSELTLISLMRQQILRTDNDIGSVQIYLSQLRISASRAPVTRSGGQQSRAKEVGSLADRIEKYRDDLIDTRDRLTKARARTVVRINRENASLWQTQPEPKQTVANVLQMMVSEQFRSEYGSETFSTGSRLRMALFALAAIPEDDRNLDDALRKLIVEYPLRKSYAPLGIAQFWGVAFNPKDIHQAAAGDELGTVRVWDPLASGSATAKELSNWTGVVNGVAFSPDGTLLAAAYRNSGAVVWDLKEDRRVCAIPNPGAYSVAFSPDGNLLAIGGNDRAAHVLEVSREALLCQRRGMFRHNDDVNGVAFDPDGRLLATASGDGSVSVWRLDQPERPLLHETFGSPVFAVAFSPNGRTLVISTANGTGHILNIETRGRIALSPPQNGTVGQVAFSPDGRFVVATANDDGAAIVSDANTGKMLYALGGNSSATLTQRQLFGVAFSPDSKYLLTGNLDGVARLWLLGDRQPPIDREIATADRNELIRIGKQRFGDADMVLSANECSALRQMRIPIFAFAVRPWEDTERPWEENLQTTLCPLPFLDPPG